MCAKSLVCERVECAGLHIGLKQKIPRLGVERGISGAKRREFLAQKILNLLFNQFNFAHTSPARKYTGFERSCQPLHGLGRRCAPHREAVFSLLLSKFRR